MIYIVPILIIVIIIYGTIKRVSIYDCFVDGAREGLKLIIKTIPYISAVFILIALLRASGLTQKLSNVLEKPMALLGIPKEVIELIILRPFSGGGSIAILADIFTRYGTDSYIGKVSAVIMGSTETIFYICAIYFSNVKTKGINPAIPISLFATFIGAIFGALFVRIL